jgi:predicted nucleotidyltransferase
MPRKINNVFKIIVDKLNGLNFAFIGSANLYIQGIQNEPRDIDILTTSSEIKKIDSLLSEYRTKDIYFDETEGRNSYRSFYKIDDFEIEVLGNVKNLVRDPKNLERKLLLKFDNLQLPCISLQDELETYNKMGRIEKANLIKEHLKNK